MSRKSSKIMECFINENVDDYLNKELVRPKVCQNLPVEYEHEGKYYCLLHYPNLDKIEEFEEEFENRLAAEEYDFRGVYFPALVSIFFSNFKKLMDFSSAIFMRGIRISSSDFSAPLNFIGAIFHESSYFSDITFSQFSQYVSFHAAIFAEDSDTSFSEIKFENEVDFSYAIFKGYVTFEGDRTNRLFEGENTFLNSQHTRLENPEKISFHRVRLCPSWFVNTDSRKMVFTDVVWDNLNVFKFRNEDINAEIKSLEKREVSEPSRLLEIACRQLAVNAEENNRYEEAAKFRYMAMETKRLEYKWWGRLWTLSWWYKWTSGYGESWQWAAVVLLIVILFFGVLYASPLSTFDYGEQANEHILVDVIEQESDWTKKYDARFHKMNLGEGLVHSLYVAAFQRPEPKAADTLTKFFVILETIFAPLQAALLALAIRRKFMR